MSYHAKVIADSISRDGVRLTTFEVEYPHAIHKDIMTHRMLSRNFLSFRAFPPEKVIGNIERDPFRPETFDTRVTGMGQGTAHPDQSLAAEIWDLHIQTSLAYARSMIGLKLAKAQVNFVLQDLTWIRGIITATEWDNFWALRADPDNVRPEVSKIARMMKDAYRQSLPRLIGADSWHLPLVKAAEIALSLDVIGYPQCDPGRAADVFEYWKRVSVGRCARVSYLTHNGVRDPLADIALHDALLADGHMSPFEHVARPQRPGDLGPVQGIRFWGNFRGWVQYRKEIPNEADYSLATA